MNLANIVGDIKKIAAEAGRYIMSEYSASGISGAEQKGLHDFVTHVDTGSEELLVKRLGDLVPSAGFIVEEKTSLLKGDQFMWIVDPLDGTTNFIHGIHPFSVSIALAEKGEVIAGVVLEASGTETFSAWKNGGAWLNGKKIQVSQNYSLPLALISTGFPYKDFSRLPGYLKCLEFLMQNTAGIRRMGSAAIDLCYVACGRFDLFFEYGLNPWDVAAGMLIVKEAGGVISDFSGNDSDIMGKEIIASNAAIYPDLVKIIRNFMVEGNLR